MQQQSYWGFINVESIDAILVVVSACVQLGDRTTCGRSSTRLTNPLILDEPKSARESTASA